MLRLILHRYIVILFMFSFIAGCKGNKESPGNNQVKIESPVKQEMNIQKETPKEIKTPEKKASPSTIKIIEGIKVTFIELGSVNCIPCKMKKPVMEEVEKEYGDQVKVVFHDVWTEAGKPYAQQYGIRAIPTQVFLDKDGKEFYRHMGFFAKEELVKILKMGGVE